MTAADDLMANLLDSLDKARANRTTAIPPTTIVIPLAGETLTEALVSGTRFPADLNETVEVARRLIEMVAVVPDFVILKAEDVTVLLREMRTGYVSAFSMQWDFDIIGSTVHMYER